MNVSIIREDLIRAETLGRRRSSSRATAAVAVSALVLADVSVLYANAQGIILNVTPSLPIGLYRLSPLPAMSDLHDGDMVYACPPDPSASPACVGRSNGAG